MSFPLQQSPISLRNDFSFFGEPKSQHIMAVASEPTLFQLLQRLDYFFRMAVNFDLRKNFANDAVAIDDNGRPFDSHVLASVERLHLVNAVGCTDASCRRHSAAES